MNRTLALITVVVLFAACSPKADAPSAPKPIATTSPEPTPTAALKQPVAPFLGHWRQSAVIVAPWWDGKGEKPEADPEFASTDTVLTATSSWGPGIVHCDEAVYSPTTLPPDSLFEGGLTKDPAKQAAALGFTGADIPTLMQGCKSSTGDLELLFHLVDADTMMLGLNNMIYTLKRVPPPPGGRPSEPPKN